MNLRQLVRSMETHDANRTIFVAAGDLSEDSSVALVDLENEEGPEGMRELVDMWHAREILDGVSNLDPGLKEPGAEDRLLSRFIGYLQNDA